MNERRGFFEEVDPEHRSDKRKRLVKNLISKGHSRAVAIKKAKTLIK